jgi:hypothetical protein
MSKPRLNGAVFADVAAAINAAAHSQLISEAELHGVRLAAENIAAKFAEKSQSFDRALFLRNCFGSNA